MKSIKLRLGLFLFFLGLLGILSLLTLEIPMTAEAKAILERHLSPFQIKLLNLINPTTTILLIAVVIGVQLQKKGNLKTSVFESVVSGKLVPPLMPILMPGILGGIIAGIATTLIAAIYKPLLPQEFIEAGKKLQPGIAVRFLYGGITEEIMMRFGLMTLIVWFGCDFSHKSSAIIYWAGIVIAAVLFALSHFPIVYQTIPEPTFTLLSYILIGNVTGGIIFGWLYWKKGLESAMFAHIIGHAVILLAGYLTNLSV